MTTHTVLVIGAGFAGLGAAAELLRNGIDDFVVLERSERVGGTWRDNTYPGAACDIPSHLYSYSFAPKPDWSSTYAGSDEILRYLDDVADRLGLRAHVRTGTDVVGLTFDEATGAWTATTRDGRVFVARCVFLSTGPLSKWSLPPIRGRETYRGTVMHSAGWDHDFDFRGKRVAVIGTGASAVQIVPELVKQVRSLEVFQRTPGWVLPRPKTPRADVSGALLRAVPSAQALARRAWYLGHEVMALGLVWNSPATTMVEATARLHLRRQVRDPWLRRQLTPDFRAGCKRMLMSNDYYPALQRPNCKLVTWPIATLCPEGLRTADGIERRFDAVVFATGFDVTMKTGTPFPVVGLGGRALHDVWARGAQAYKSVSVSGFPNLFLTFGPNSGPGHNSALVYMEAQIRYAVQAIRHLVDHDLRLLDVPADRQARFNERLQARMRHTTWNSGCASWYLTPDGFNAAMFPGFATEFETMLRTFDPGEYVTGYATACAPQSVSRRSSSSSRAPTHRGL